MKWAPLKYLADETFFRSIVIGMRRQAPDLEVKTVHEAGLAHADDPAILEWAAAQGFVLLTHDRETIPAFINEFVAADKPTRGVFILKQNVEVGKAVEVLLLIAQCSFAGEWDNRYVFIRP
jgi:predicted nuclease of predicted toxin-antitoxin system